MRYSKKNMEEGARKVGKDPAKLAVGCVIVGSIGRDSAKGKEGARAGGHVPGEQGAEYQRISRRFAGVRGDHLRRAATSCGRDGEGGRKAAAKAVTDELLKKVCPIAGTPDDVPRTSRSSSAQVKEKVIERIGIEKLFPKLAPDYDHAGEDRQRVMMGRAVAAMAKGLKVSTTRHPVISMTYEHPYRCWPPGCSTPFWKNTSAAMAATMPR